MTAQNVKDTKVTLTIGNIVLFISNAIIATTLIVGYKGKIDNNSDNIKKIQVVQDKDITDLQNHIKEEAKETILMNNKQSVTDAKLDYIIKQLDKR